MAKGSPAQNVAYCTKEATRVSQEDYVAYCQKNDMEPTKMPHIFFKDGIPEPQGKRTDIDAFVEDLEVNDFADTAMKYPNVFVKYAGGLAKINMYIRQKKAQEWRTVNVHVIYGATGVGKTRSALEQANEMVGGSYLHRKDIGKTMWWDGYTGQKVLVLDEYHGNWMPYKSILGILDGHGYRCPVKGSFVWAEWTTVFITSSGPPHSWYQREEYSELDRRITSVTWLRPQANCMPGPPDMLGEEIERSGGDPPSQSGGNTAALRVPFPTLVTSTSSQAVFDFDMGYDPVLEFEAYERDCMETLHCLENLGDDQ